MCAPTEALEDSVVAATNFERQATVLATVHWPFCVGIRLTYCVRLFLIKMRSHFGELLTQTTGSQTLFRIQKSSHGVGRFCSLQRLSRRGISVPGDLADERLFAYNYPGCSRPTRRWAFNCEWPEGTLVGTPSLPPTKLSTWCSWPGPPLGHHSRYPRMLHLMSRQHCRWLRPQIRWLQRISGPCLRHFRQPPYVLPTPLHSAESHSSIDYCCLQALGSNKTPNQHSAHCMSPR